MEPLKYNRIEKLERDIIFLESKFKFLVDKFGYELKAKMVNEKGMRDTILIYNSSSFKKEIEIAIDNSACEVSVAHLIDDFSFDDDYNYIPITFLNKTKQDEKSHYKYIPWSEGKEEVVENIIKKINEFEYFFNSDYWFSKDEVDLFYQNTLNFKPKPKEVKTSIAKTIENELLDYFNNNNFNLVERSWDIPSYMNNSMWDLFTYEKKGKRITYTNIDWRDFYLIYELKINDKSIFEEDFSGKSKDKEYIELITKRIIKHCNRAFKFSFL